MSPNAPKRPQKDQPGPTIVAFPAQSPDLDVYGRDKKLDFISSKIKRFINNSCFPSHMASTPLDSRI